MQLQDAEVGKKYKEQFRQLCKEFEDMTLQTWVRHL